METTAIRQVGWPDILRAPAGERLIAEYAEECAIPALGTLNPQAEIYEALGVAGLMQYLGVYAGDKLAGFAAILTTILPHYGAQVATTESLFVSPDHRRGGLGTALMAVIEESAKESGSRGVFYSAPHGSRLERLLEARRYLRTSTVFYKGVQ